MKVSFLEPAEEEFLEAVDFYEDIDEGLAQKLIDDIETSLNLLAENPGIGAPFTEKTRRLSLSHFPFDLVYFLEEEKIVIAAVAHHRREPNYWRDR